MLAVQCQGALSIEVSFSFEWGKGKLGLVKLGEASSTFERKAKREEHFCQAILLILLKELRQKE